MPRTAIILLAVLTLLTGLLLGQFHQFAGSRSVAVPARSEPVTGSLAAESFYAALNDVIRTGDGAYLESLVAPNFVDHSVLDGTSGSLSSLQRYFQTLHERAPRSTLQVSDVTAEGALVAVRLRLEGGDVLTAAGLPLQGAMAQGFELLRIEEDLIQERWASPTLPPLIESLGSLTLEAIPTWVREPRLELITLAADAELSVDDHEGTLLRVETGEVSVQIYSASTMPASDDSNDTATPPARSHSWSFLQGDAQGIPAHTPFRIRNGGAEPASVVWLRIDRTNTYVYDASQNNSRTPSPGIDRLLLAAGVAIRPEQGPFRVVVDRVVGATDLAIPRHSAGEFELLLVESGAIDVQTHSRYVLGVSSLGGLRVESDDVQIEAGHAIAVPLSADLEYAVAGSDPATFWIVTVTVA